MPADGPGEGRHRQQLDPAPPGHRPDRADGAAHLQAGAYGHQTQRGRGRAQPGQRHAEDLGRMQPEQVGDQPAGGGQDQRIARQLAPQPRLAVPRQRPHRGHIAHRHHAADDHRHHRQPFAAAEARCQRQRDIRIEAERGLQARGEIDRIGPQHPFDRVAGGHAEHRGQHRQPEHRRRGREIEYRAVGRLQQQRGEQHEVDQAFDAGPEAAIERGIAHQQPADQDQAEIGHHQQGRRHRRLVVVGTRGARRRMSGRWQERWPQPARTAFQQRVEAARSAP